MGSGLADEHAPRMAERAPHRGVLEWRPPGEQGAPCFGDDAGGVDQVLDRYRNTEQGSVVPLSQGPFGLDCLGEGGLGGDGGKCVDLIPDRLDPRQQRFDHLDRRELTLAIPVSEFSDS